MKHSHMKIRSVEGFSLTRPQNNNFSTAESNSVPECWLANEVKGGVPEPNAPLLLAKSLSVVSDLSGYAGNELKSLKYYDKLLKKRASLLTVVCVRCFIEYE